MMEVSLSSSLPMPSSDMAAAPVAASAASATQQYSAETEPMSHASSSSFCHQFSSSESRPSSMHGPMVTGKEAAARPELPPIVDMPMRDSQARTLIAYSGDKPSNQGLPPLCHSPPIPAFLEPAPQLDNHRIGQYELAFRPHLFASFKEKSFSSPEQQQQLSNNHYSHQQQHHHHRWSLPSKPTLQIPTARRSSQPLPYLQPRPADQEVRSGPEHNRSEDVEAQYSPMSPTMATASAAAAAAAVQHHPGSAVAEAFLKCLRYSGLRNNPSTPPPCSLSSSSSTNDSTSSSDDEALLEEQDEATRIAAEALAAASADAHHRAAQEEQQRNNNLVSLVMQNKRPSTSSGIDHSKFLTKNAHIKRPRNAWIHFRCHYGQALKSQDPTLRAEEISKRASRRWARLTEKEKKPWHDLAEQEKIAHKEAFPEYRYCPKRHSSASSLSSFSSSSLASPSSTAAGNNNALMFAADTDGDAQSAADGQLRGDTSGHRYKKARRRTK